MSGYSPCFCFYVILPSMLNLQHLPAIRDTITPFYNNLTCISFTFKILYENTFQDISNLNFVDQYPMDEKHFFLHFKTRCSFCFCHISVNSCPFSL